MLSAMKNFNYANITRIVFGKGQIAKLPSLIPSGKKVLLTYGGGSIKRNGVYNQVMDALKGYSVTEFSGIEANPDFDTVVKAVDIVKKLGVDDTFLLAVGGGSVSDGTKFIAAASKYSKTSDPWDMVTSGGKGIESAVPMGCIMTLPAVLDRALVDRVDGIGEQQRSRSLPQSASRALHLPLSLLGQVRIQLAVPVPPVRHSGS